jgi:carboxymethylenebutenolidase
VYFAHADHDHAMPQEQIDRLEAALHAAGVRFRSEIYPGAEHGFTMADTAAYSAEAEQRHWENLFDLLDTALPTPGRPLR